VIFQRFTYRGTNHRGPTPRRLAAARRFLQRERDKAPLFAAEIATSQETPEERIARLDRYCEDLFQGLRSLAARQWREGRRMLRELPSEVQAELMAYWNDDRTWIPRKAEYFCDMVRHWERTVEAYRYRAELRRRGGEKREGAHP